MAAAELPSFYGQTTKDGSTIQRPTKTKKMEPKAGVTDMAAFAGNNRYSQASTQFGQSFQEKIVNESANDSIIHPALRRRPAPSESPSSLKSQTPLDRTNHQRDSARRRRRDYGGRDSDEGSEDSDSMDSEEWREHRRRRHIRRKLKRKHQAEVIIPLRIPWTKWMHSDTKNHFVAFIGEFVGTTMFLFFAFAGTQVANIGSGNSSNQSTTGSATGFNPTVFLYISLCFGFSLAVNAWVFFRISGGLFNPAVTLALFLLRLLPLIRAIIIFIAQLTGACFAAYLVKVLFPTPLNVRTTLGANTSIAQGLFIEAMCTAELVFTIAMLAAEKHKATFIAPIGIGLALFIAELVAVYYTGGSLNPARSFGPSAVTHTFSHVDWIYWVGPALGALLAVGFYRFIKILEYEMANPGQDGDAKNDPTQNPDHEIAQAVEERREEVEELRVVEEEGGLEELSAGESVIGEGSVVGEGDGAATMGESPVIGGPLAVLGRLRGSRKGSRTEGSGSRPSTAVSPQPEGVVAGEEHMGRAL